MHLLEDRFEDPEESAEEDPEETPVRAKDPNNSWQMSDP
jgi:hypothetical protein